MENQLINLYNSAMNIAQLVANSKELDQKQLSICFDVVGTLLAVTKGEYCCGAYTYDDIKTLINS